MPVSLNANALITLDVAKLYLKIPLSETSQDDLVKTFINDVSSLVESYCNRRFIQQSYTEYHDGSRVSEIITKQWPIVSVTNLWVDADRVFGSDSLVPATSYQIGTNDNGEGFTVERFDTIFPRGRKTVKVQYLAGYLLADVPGDLQLATKRTLGYYWKQQQNFDLTETNKSKGDENITLIDGIPEAATVILDNYKRLEMSGDSSAMYNL